MHSRCFWSFAILALLGVTLGPPSARARELDTENEPSASEAQKDSEVSENSEAHEDSEANEASEPSEESEANEDSDETKGSAAFDLDLTGESLEELLTLLQERDPNFSFMVVGNGPSPTEIKLPRMHLKHVDTDTILELLQGAELSAQVDFENPGNLGIEAYRITIHEEEHNPDDTDDEIVMRIFDLRPIAKHMYRSGLTGESSDSPTKTVEMTVVPRTVVNIDGSPSPQSETALMTEILAAVDHALGMGAPDDEAPQIKFHTGTGVLMVRGTQRQINVVEELMHALLPPQAASEATGIAAQRALELMQSLPREVTRLLPEDMLDQLKKAQSVGRRPIQTPASTPQRAEAIP